MKEDIYGKGDSANKENYKKEVLKENSREDTSGKRTVLKIKNLENEEYEKVKSEKGQF